MILYSTPQHRTFFFFEGMFFSFSFLSSGIFERRHFVLHIMTGRAFCLFFIFHFLGVKEEGSWEDGK